MAGEANKYLISFLATLKGHKAVTKGLRQMESAVKKQRKEMGVATTKTKHFGEALGGIMKRALLTIPVWLLLRTVFMGILRTITEMIKANLDLQEGMARIRTVVSASSDNVEGDMLRIKRAILDVAVTTRIPIKELAETFYFLRTSNLSTEEAMSAFIPTVNAMVGTMNKGRDTARAIAGIYNTMGKRLGDNLTITEKFVKISDALTYTYATQDVQLDELIQGYSKIAPFTVGLSDTFTELITLIGFLNTRMLRGGRTGRLLGRTILQITKNARHLAKIFSVTFDPSAPISLLGTLEAISRALEKQTVLTFEQQRALQRIFATRGAVAPKLVLQDFDELRFAIERAEERLEGFAEKMREAREATAVAQFARMKNILAVLFDDLSKGIFSVGDLTEAITRLNDNLEKSRNQFQALGDAIGYTIYLYKGLARIDEVMKKIRSGGLADVIAGFASLEEALKIKTPVEFLQDQIENEQKILKIREEQAKTREQAIKDEEEARKSRAIGEKRENEILRHQTALLKEMGVHELDILDFKVEQLAIIYEATLLEEDLLKLEKARNLLSEAQLRFRQTMLNTVDRAELDLLKAMGISELEINKRIQEQLVNRRELVGEAQFMLQMTKLRLREQILIQQQHQKELQAVTNIALMYEKADELEKTRVRRMIQLRALDPSGIVKAFQESVYDKDIIIDYWGQFTKSQREAIAKFIAEKNKLEITPPPEAETPFIDLDKLLPTDKITEYWRAWSEQGIEAGDVISTHFVEQIREKFGEADLIGALLKEPETVKTETELLAEVKQYLERQEAKDKRILQQMEAKLPAISPARPTPLPVVTTGLPDILIKAVKFGDIVVNLPKEALNTIIDSTVGKFREVLEASDALKDWLANLLRPRI